MLEAVGMQVRGDSGKDQGRAEGIRGEGKKNQPDLSLTEGDQGSRGSKG